MKRTEPEKNLTLLVYEKDIDYFIKKYMTSTNGQNCVQMYVGMFIDEINQAQEYFGHNQFNQKYSLIGETDGYKERARAMFYTRDDIFGK